MNTQKKIMKLSVLIVILNMLSKAGILAAGTEIEPWEPGAPKYTAELPLSGSLAKKLAGARFYFVHTSKRIFKVSHFMSILSTCVVPENIAMSDCSTTKCLVLDTLNKIELYDANPATCTSTHSFNPPTGSNSNPITVTVLYGATNSNVYGYGDSSGTVALITPINVDTLGITVSKDFGPKSIASIFKPKGYAYLGIGFLGGGKTKVVNRHTLDSVREFTHTVLGDTFYSSFYRAKDQELRIFAFIFPNVLNIFSELEESLVKSITYSQSNKWKFVTGMEGTSYTAVIPSGTRILIIDFDGGILEEIDLPQYPGLTSLAFNQVDTEFAFTQSGSPTLRIKPWEQSGPVPFGCPNLTVIKTDKDPSYLKCMNCLGDLFLHRSETCFDTSIIVCEGQGNFFGIEDDGSRMSCYGCPSCCNSCNSLTYSPSDVYCTWHNDGWLYSQSTKTCEKLLTNYTTPSVLSHGRKGCEVGFVINSRLMDLEDINLFGDDGIVTALPNITLDSPPSTVWRLNPESKKLEATMNFEFDSSADGLEIAIQLKTIRFTFPFPDLTQPQTLIVKPLEITPTILSCPKSPEQGSYKLTQPNSNTLRLSFSSEISNSSLSILNIEITKTTTETPFDIKFTITSPTEITLIFENPEPEFEEYISILTNFYGISQYFEINETQIEVEKEYDFPFLQSNEEAIKTTTSIISQSGMALSGFFPLLSELFYSFNVIKIISMVPLKIPKRLKALLCIFIDLDYSNLLSKITKAQEPDKVYIPYNIEFQFKSSYFYRRLLQSVLKFLLSFLFLFNKDYLAKKKILKFFVEKLVLSHLCTIYFDFVINFLYIYSSLLTKFFLLDLSLILFDLSITVVNHVLIISVYLKYSKKEKRATERKFREEKIVDFYYKNFSTVFGPFPLRIAEGYIGVLELTTMIFLLGSKIAFLLVAGLVLPLTKIVFVYWFRNVFGNVIFVERVITELAKSALFLIFFIGEKNDIYRDSSLNLTLCVILLCLVLFLKFSSSIVLFWQLRMDAKKRKADDKGGKIEVVEVEDIVHSTRRKFLKESKPKVEKNKVAPEAGNGKRRSKKRLQIRDDRRIINKRYRSKAKISVEAIKQQAKKRGIQIGSGIKERLDKRQGKQIDYKSKYLDAFEEADPR